jgi:hypothetical protein
MRQLRGTLRGTCEEAPSRIGAARSGLTKLAGECRNRNANIKATPRSGMAFNTLNGRVWYPLGFCFLHAHAAPRSGRAGLRAPGLTRRFDYVRLSVGEIGQEFTAEQHRLGAVRAHTRQITP